MSDKQPTFSFAAPASDNKTASNPFGQASSSNTNTTGSLFGAKPGVSGSTNASPFANVGGGSTTSATAAFGGESSTASSSQVSSPFGAFSKPAGSTFGAPSSSGATGLKLGGQQDAKDGPSSTSIFTPDKPFGSAQSLGGFGQTSAGSGGLFQNLGSAQPNAAPTGSTTPATSKPMLSFNNPSTTPAGPPPITSNGSINTSGSFSGFAKPQQPASTLFGAKADTQASAQPTSASSAPPNPFSDPSKPSGTDLFGAQAPANVKTSNQPPSGLFGNAGNGSKPGPPGSNDFEAAPAPFSSLGPVKINSTPATFITHPVILPTGVGSELTPPQSLNQPGNAPKVSNLFGLSAPGTATANLQQPTTSIFSTSGNGASSSQAPQATFKFPSTTTLAANPPQSAPATSDAFAASSTLFTAFSKPSTGQPTSAPVPTATASSIFAKPSQPAEATTTSSPSIATTFAGTSLFTKPTQPAETATSRPSATATSVTSNPVSTSGLPPSTAAATSSTEGTKTPATTADASAKPAATTPAIGVQPTATNLGGSISGPPPPPQSRLKNKSMEEIITGWAKDLGEYQKEFQKQAHMVASWDQLLVENGDRIQKLYASTIEAEKASSEVERQLSSVVNQQEELSGWLDRYEKEVDEILSRQVGQGEGLQGPDQERERTYKLAEKLSDRLDDMGKDLKSMVEEINSASLTFSKTKGTEDPLSQVVKILNSHLSSLQWIDLNAAALQVKVSAAQKLGKGMASNGYGGLEEDAVNDFYKSFLGRR